MAVSIYQGEPTTIEIIFDDNPLQRQGATLDDVSETYFGLKKNIETDADDEYLSKTTGITLNAATKQFLITLDQADTKELNKGAYEIVLGVKIPNYDELIELNMSPDRLNITPDKIRS